MFATCPKCVPSHTLLIRAENKTTTKTVKGGEEMWMAREPVWTREGACSALALIYAPNGERKLNVCSWVASRMRVLETKRHMVAWHMALAFHPALGSVGPAFPSPQISLSVRYRSVRSGPSPRASALPTAGLLWHVDVAFPQLLCSGSGWGNIALWNGEIIARINLWIGWDVVLAMPSSIASD